MARMSRFLISAAIVGIAVADNTIFVTEEKHNGDFGGSAGAAAFCASEAAKATGLPTSWCAMLGYNSCYPSYPELIQPGGAPGGATTVSVNQHGDTYTGDFWSGQGRTCNDWTTSDSSTNAETGRVNADSSAQFRVYNKPCNFELPVVCVSVPGDFEQEEEEEEEQSDCGKCVTTFMAGGGCDDFYNEALVPPGCDDCGAAAWKACGKPGDFEQEEEEEQSASVDCSLMTDKNTCRSTDVGDYSLCSWNRMAKTCEHCMTTCLTEFYFNNDETSLCECMCSEKAKSCTSETKALYGSMFCISGLEEPESPDVCVGLKKQKCKKQDTCEFKKKQCISIDEPIDVCVGLRKKQCKKQEGVCKFKKKTKECAMI
jgi:hypothetical protein